MLRRKLMLMLGPVIVLLAIVSIAALWMLEGVLRDLKQMDMHGLAHQAIIAKFGAVLLAMGLVFLVLVNAASVALLRTATMVLRPVERLIEGSRELAQQNFEHRVHVDDEAGEFSELADAFNDLAQRLQDTEKRRVEVLGQMALTLNHELNNALAIIELRLHPLARRAGDDPGTQKCLREIRETLAKMTNTIASFKHVRRIVLTDYTDGVKMLDLEKSVDVQPELRT
jgi:signal transduction histidine kinase